MDKIMEILAMIFVFIVFIAIVVGTFFPIKKVVEDRVDQAYEDDE